MTIETSPANNLFSGFSEEEKRWIRVAVRRVEELEDTRRISAGLAGQASAIQADLQARGVGDAQTLREAAEAVAATASVQGRLAGEVDGYRKLFGPDGRAAAAVGQYVQLLRNGRTGDVDALNAVQAARRELYEARDASARQRGAGRAHAGQAQVAAAGAAENAIEAVRLAAGGSGPGGGPGGPGGPGRRPSAPERDDGSLDDTQTFFSRYRRVADTWVRRDDPSRVVLVDKGSRLRSPYRLDMESVQAMTELAEARGWTAIRVSGNAQFRQAVYLAAASRGIAVRGYTPSEAERRLAADMAERRQREAERQARRRERGAPEHGDPERGDGKRLAAAYASARTARQRRAAVARHPQLRQAFALELAYLQMARKIQGQPGRDAFMERMRENIASDLAYGRRLPDLRLRGQGRGQGREPARGQAPKPPEQGRGVER